MRWQYLGHDVRETIGLLILGRSQTTTGYKRQSIVPLDLKISFFGYFDNKREWTVCTLSATPPEVLLTHLSRRPSGELIGLTGV